MIYASSSSVYGDTPTLPKREDILPNPHSPYAVTKLAGEYYCKVFHEVYGLTTVCLRYFNVYGPRQDSNAEYAAVIPKFISRLAKGKSPIIFGDGEQTRDFTFVKDAVEASILAAESNTTGVFNVGTGKRVSINELTKLITRLIGKDMKPVYQPPRPRDVRHSLADISRAKAFGYNPRHDLGGRAGGNYQGVHSMKRDWGQVVIGIVGLGYIGLALAQAFSKSLKVVGFDMNEGKVNQLNKSQQLSTNLTFTTNPKEIARADFVIICVPTPLTKSREPDLSYVRSAANVAGQNMKKGSTVIVESTVYPGVSEEIVKPILEKGSSLKCGEDFNIAYSPERINPGDKEHTLDKTTKVVAGMDNETTELVANLYSRVTPHIFRAKDIKTAEAAKVIENIQRDLNIALMNELSLIFERMGLSTKDILEAANTKWNFHSCSPGLVGGHCIPVAPYHLVYKAEELGYHPQVVLAGRSTNDYMPKHIAGITAKALNSVGKVIQGSRVLILGLTYKENVGDIRGAPAKEMIRWLREYGIDVFAYDPLLDDIEQEFEVEALSGLDNVSGIDCVILAVAHEAFKEITSDELKGIMNAKPVLIDVRGIFDDKEAIFQGIHYCSL